MLGSAITDAAAESASTEPIARGSIAQAVEEILGATPVIDVHTHLFPAEFESLAQWGIDDLLTYHYLEAELFRSSPISPQEYWKLSKPRRADIVWRTLFLDNTPLSEATRGVTAVLEALGLDTAATGLEGFREFFRDQNLAGHISRVFRLAGVCTAVMTNDPLDENEAALWNRGLIPDTRFHAALRLDRLVNDWKISCGQLAAQGFSVNSTGSAKTHAEIRRFLEVWAERTKPLYMAVSLPDTFQFPADDDRTRVLEGAILPAGRDLGLPLCLMIGVRRQVNPAIGLAGDAAGRADLRSLENMCREFPENRFLVSVLSRENQHELCVYARKFSNLMPFGCWWFLNNSSIVEEVFRERLEMLGTGFIAQHSDARILEQLIYKWRNTRRTIGPLLAKSYELLADDGRPVTRNDLRRDIGRLFRSNFEQWTSLPRVANA